MDRTPRLLAALLALVALATAAPASAAPVAAPDGLSAAPQAVPRTAALRATTRATGDPLLAEQWPLSGDAAIGATTAWAQTTGGDAVVAVLDSGADLGHPDLAPNLWTNPGEVPGNGVDDDANGIVDDVHGADLVGRDGDPSDLNGHGTHVAGIVAGRGGNGFGIAGVAWKARLMVVRVLDADAAGDTGTVARGIDYAVAEGARVINLSLSGPAPSAQLEAAIRRAKDAGVLVVAAAGNDGRDLALLPSWPAASTEENVLAVGATRPDGLLATISNLGRGVDLAAPGDSVLSAARGGGFEWRTGTSMAAPHVAGALVLLAAARPDLDWRALKGALLGGARRTGLPVEAGALDVAAALRAVVDPARWVTPAAADAVPEPAARAAKASGKKKSAKKKPCTTGSAKKRAACRKAAKKRAAAAKKRAAAAKKRAAARRRAR